MTHARSLTRIFLYRCMQTKYVYMRDNMYFRIDLPSLSLGLMKMLSALKTKKTKKQKQKKKKKKKNI